MCVLVNGEDAALGDEYASLLAHYGTRSWNELDKEQQEYSNLLPGHGFLR
jgi:hypothetical protein